MNNNPHNICTWKDPAFCNGCSLQHKLACKWDKKILLGFHGISWPPTLTAAIGMAIVGTMTSVWWPIYAYVIYFLLMFGFIEIKFLCSHCPYYAEEGKVLHCLANHGSPKIWSYNPRPLNRFEKFMMYFLIATVFFVFPLSVFGYGIFYLILNYADHGLIALLGLIGIMLSNLISSASFAGTLKTFYCSQCVNFSCPLNTVPKPAVDTYLRKNRIMREAWEKSGYQLDPMSAGSNDSIAKVLVNN